MERCPVCKARMWNQATHTCANRWVAVITDDKPDKPFVWSNYSAYTDIFSTDAQGVAEEAADKFDSAVSEYPSQRTVGVMAYDEYCEWYYGDQHEEDFMDPARLTWFDVECYPVPTYRATEHR